MFSTLLALLLLAINIAADPLECDNGLVVNTMCESSVVQCTGSFAGDGSKACVCNNPAKPTMECIGTDLPKYQPVLCAGTGRFCDDFRDSVLSSSPNNYQVGDYDALEMCSTDVDGRCTCTVEGCPPGQYFDENYCECKVCEPFDGVHYAQPYVVWKDGSQPVGKQTSVCLKWADDGEENCDISNSACKQIVPGFDTLGAVYMEGKRCVSASARHDGIDFAGQRCKRQISGCGKGEYVSGSLNSTTVEATCIECPDGQYQPEENSKAEACMQHPPDDGFSCGQGFRLNDLTRNTLKSRGFNAISDCIACEKGTFQGKTGFTKRTCIPFERFCGKNEGFDSNEQKADGTCFPCPEGTYQPKSNHQIACIATPVDTRGKSDTSSAGSGVATTSVATAAVIALVAVALL